MNVHFEVVKEAEYEVFRKDVKDIFSIAVKEEFGELEDEVITDEEINESLDKTEGTSLLCLCRSKESRWRCFRNR